tara:strand:- start:385 stop:1779 length:1395 start_codon:yes stop_codon:yes gene_type:complete
MSISQVLRVKLIRNSLPNLVGGSMILSGDTSDRRLTISVMEELKGASGNFTERVLHEISLSYLSVANLIRILNESRYLDSNSIGGSSNAPANLIQEVDAFGTSNGSSIGLDWNVFGIPEEYLSYNNPEIMDSNKISFFLTSIDPSSELYTTQRSFGKYINSVSLLEESSILSDTSLYDMSMAISGDFDLVEGDYIQANSEVIRVSSYLEGDIHLKYRAEHQTLRQFHQHKDIVRKLDTSRVFSSSFGENSFGELEQFRCFAAMNNSQETLGDVEVLSSGWSVLGKSSFSFFIEIPMVESFRVNVVDGNFSDFYVEEIDEYNLNKPITNPEGIDPFVDQIVTFTGGENSGQQRIVVNYNVDSGKFLLNEDLPYKIEPGDEVLFSASPSSTSYTGTADPRTTNNGIYSQEVSIKSSESISIKDTERSRGGNMSPGDIIYLWVRRVLSESSVVSDEFPSLDFLYKVV